MDTKDRPDINKKEQSIREFNAWALALELGWQIALPLVVFALAGRYADRVLGTSPWLLVLGVILAATTSTIIIYRKVKKILD